MVLDDSGLGQSMLYALTSDKSVATYRRTINANKDKLPPVGNVKTIFVDRSLAQLNVFYSASLGARVYFYGFHSPMDMRHRCGSLQVSVKWDGARILK